MRILAICGGNGTWLYPFREELIANIEPRSVYKTPNNIQWDLNFPEVGLYHKLGTMKGVDVIVGAPDCGHSSVFSLSRTKKFHDPKQNDSIGMFIEGIKRYYPKIWVMENLPKMLELFPIEDWRKLFPNYTIVHRHFNCTEIGNSQPTRKRMVLYGMKKPYTMNTVYPLFKPFQVNTPMKVRELLNNLPENGHIREDLDSVISLYARKKMSLREIQEKWKTIQGKRWYIDEKEGSAMKTAPGVYRIRNWDYPVTVRKTNRQFNPDGLMMSPRELARIQGIPDEFKIWTDLERPEYCINKGRITVAKTPPYEFGLWLKAILDQYFMT